MIPKVFLSWSGGKDSALALYKAKRSGIPVASLITTFSKATGRVTMHGVPQELIAQQARALKLPLLWVALPEKPGMGAYEEAMHQLHRQLKSEGYTHGIFGDIFLEDLKQYREKLLAAEGLQTIFPLWGMTSSDVVNEFVQTGFTAVVVCTDKAVLNKEFCGRTLDETFLAQLPSAADPSGENGEYHSFVFDGPLFSSPVAFQKGEVVYREYPAPRSRNDCFTNPLPSRGFYFCELVPV